MIETTQVPLELGQTVLLGVGAAGHEQWSRTMVRRVDPRMVWLDGAPEGQPVIDARPGLEVVCNTWRHMDALYLIQARVGMTVLEPGPLLGLQILKTQRVQQREYVRVPLSAEAWAIRDAYDTPGDAPVPFRLQVQDLSAGGLRGRTARPLNPGDELTIDLPLPDAPPPQVAAPLLLRGRVVLLHDLPSPLNLRARVVRLVETELPTTLACEIGVTFLDVPKETRERIIRFALSVQRDRRRRGML